MTLEQQYTQSGTYSFNFVSSGLFTIVNKKGEPLYESALPFFDKTMSHLVWIFFWLSLILASSIFLPISWLHLTDRLLMVLVFLHLFFFGCRLTTLLLKGGLKPILFPPLWVRITRHLQKGKKIDFLEKHGLDKHPGLLTNLALAHYFRGEYDEAALSARTALLYAPGHPLLLELVNLCSK